MASASDQSESLPTTLQELWQLVVGYARQETVEPIKGLGRFVAFGLAGALVIGLGLVMLLLGTLRLLQTETGDAFDGHLSFVPYVIVFVTCFVLAGAAIKSRGTARPKEER